MNDNKIQEIYNKIKNPSNTTLSKKELKDFLLIINSKNIDEQTLPEEITYDEFNKIWHLIIKQKKDCKSMFNKLDRNNKGYLDIYDVKYFFKKLYADMDDDQIKKIFEYLNAKNDGRNTIEEFEEKCNK